MNVKLKSVFSLIALAIFALPACAAKKPAPVTVNLKTAQALGLVPLVYTVNEPARMRELDAAGAGGIFTDRPELALPPVFRPSRP